MGNLAAAESHLDGLTTFLDFKDRQRGKTIHHDGLDEELLDRYMLL